MSRPRLLVVASTFPAEPGDGVPAFVRDLALRESESFDTLVVVPRVPNAPRETVEGAVRVRRFAYFPRRWEDLAAGAIIENLRARPTRWLQVPPFFLAEAWAVLRAVARFRPDVIHAHWIVPQGLVTLLVPRRVPVLLTTLGGDLYALRGAAVRRLKRAAVARAGAVTVMNEEMRRLVVELGAAPDRVQVVPMGADLRGLARPAGASRSGRLLFVGRLVEKKGLAVLLDALRSLPAQVRPSLDVVGDGPLRAQLERAAEGLDVTFRGQLGRDDLAAAYAAADVAVFPSVVAGSGDQDGLPVALIEAMAAGCAVVASDLPGLDEAVVAGESGVLVPSGDPRALAGAVAELLASEPTRRRLGDAAAERARGYSVETVGHRYRSLLTSLTSAEGRRATST
ncbi:glycosyltransferase [Cellulomonas sp.]|uniref:glycosyltransferase n=1 Tax=Cellulomonas sp. TaxID=40001 RepID=UPI002812259B|nr:glycosyltransferase [Cellulomonas sp.]